MLTQVRAQLQSHSHDRPLVSISNRGNTGPHHRFSGPGAWVRFNGDGAWADVLAQFRAGVMHWTYPTPKLVLAWVWPPASRCPQFTDNVPIASRHPQRAAPIGSSECPSCRIRPPCASMLPSNENELCGSRPHGQPPDSRARRPDALGAAVLEVGTGIQTAVAGDGEHKLSRDADAGRGNPWDGAGTDTSLPDALPVVGCRQFAAYDRSASRRAQPAVCI